MRCFTFVCVLFIYLSPGGTSLRGQSTEWVRLNGIDGSYITSITQTQSGAVFVSTPYALWCSKDTLRTWEKVSSGFRDSLIYSIASTGDGGLLVSTYTGIYRSTNDGKGWKNVTPVQGVKSYRYLKAHSSGICFAGTQRYLFRSTDHGNSWSLFADTIVVKEKLTYPRQYGMAIQGKDNRIIVPKYYSDNNGGTWTSFGLHVWFGFSDMFTDNSGRIVLSGREMWLPAEGVKHEYFIITTDNGKEWLRAGVNEDSDMSVEDEQWRFGRNSIASRNDEFYKMHTAGTSVIFLEKDTLLLSLFGIGIWKITGEKKDGVYKFTSKKDVTNNGFVSRYPTCSYMLRDSTLLVGSYGSGLFISKDRGEHWLPIQIPDNSPIITKFYNDKERNRMFAGTADGLFMCMDNGIQWERIDSGFHRPIITDLTVTDKGTIIASTYDKAYRREIYSKKWELIPDLSNFETTVTQLYSTASKIYATKRDLWLSDDDGKSFRKYVVYQPDNSDWRGGNKLIAENQSKKVLITIGNGLTRSVNNKWEQPKSYSYSYLDPYSLDPDAGRQWMSITSSYLSPYTEQIYLSLNYAVTTYDWDNNTIAVHDKKGEWLFGEYCFGVTADQKGRPFAATMNGIAYSPKAGKDWEFLPQPKDLSLPAMMSMGTDDKGYIYSSSLFGGVYRTKNPVIILQAPELISPLHKAQEIAKNSQLKWTSVMNAKNYTLQVSTDSTFTNIVVEDSLLTSITYGLEGLKENTTYYWRVRGRLFGIKSPWSETRTFSTITVFPSIVQLREPNNGAQNRNTTLSVLWNTTNSAENYHAQISEDNTFNNPLINDSTVTTTDKRIENLENSTEYFWRVRGKNKAGYGTWSDVWSFRTKGGINSIEEKEQKVLKVYVIGNELIIEGIPSSTNNSLLTISDIMGKKVLSSEIAKDVSSIICDIQTISNGYYIVSIDSGLVNIVHGITVLR